VANVAKVAELVEVAVQIAKVGAKVAEVAKVVAKWLEQRRTAPTVAGVCAAAILAACKGSIWVTVHC
jgi:hypothetical protein